MKVSTTTSEEMVTCRACHKQVPKRSACGVGFNGGSLSWTCTDCILDGGMDGAFAPLGDAIRDAKQAVSE